MENRGEGIWIPQEIWKLLGKGRNKLNIFEVNLISSFINFGDENLEFKNDSLAKIFNSNAQSIQSALSKFIRLGLLERVYFDGRICRYKISIETTKPDFNFTPYLEGKIVDNPYNLEKGNWRKSICTGVKKGIYTLYLVELHYFEEKILKIGFSKNIDSRLSYLNSLCKLKILYLIGFDNREEAFRIESACKEKGKEFLREFRPISTKECFLPEARDILLEPLNQFPTNILLKNIANE
jgi:hypothetical protein